MANKIRLKGHESFPLREGWIRKGLSAINNYNTNEIYDEKSESFGKDIFSRPDAVDILGVGANMVKSIKYWLQALGLTYTFNLKSKRIQMLTDDFGRIIDQMDPYIEEISTLWLLHYKLASNEALATSWYLFYNKWKVKEFTKDELFEGLQNELYKINPDLAYSQKSLIDDCNCIIKTYCSINIKGLSPEDNLLCPFTELGLLSKKKSNTEIYTRNIPTLKVLDTLVVLYVIVDNLGERNSTTIDSLIEDECNIGKIFNLDRIRINDFLEVLQKDGYLVVNRTAGLDTIYLENKIDKVEILRSIYSLRREYHNEIY